MCCANTTAAPAANPSPEALPPISTCATGPEQQAEQRDAFRRVLRHMRGLSDDQQEALALRFGAGLAYTEIAALMGCEANRVGVLLHRGIKRLQEALLREEDYA